MSFTVPKVKVASFPNSSTNCGANSGGSKAKNQAKEPLPVTRNGPGMGSPGKS